MRVKRRLWGARAVAALALIGGLGVALACQQGWLAPSWEFLSPGSSRSAQDQDHADVPPPQEVDESLVAELPDQHEPDDYRPEIVWEKYAKAGNDRVRHSQWTAADGDDADKATERAARGRKRPSRAPITTAGFEEEAPPAPEIPDEKSGRRGKPELTDSDVLARKPVEASKAAASRAGDPSATKNLPVADRARIQELMDTGDYVEAQKELSEWYWQAPAERENIVSDLNKMSRALYFAPQPQYYDPYVVKPGDQLRIVGQRYKLSWEYLAKLNRIDPRKIRMGQKLKIVPGPFGAIVCLDRYELVVHLNGSFVKSYRVGLGKDGTTPVGTFTVKNKMVDPTYYGPDGVIANDDPKNPLGERWIDIGDSYGIHGTIEPDSIGKNESRGCIRMLNSDVEEVYDFLVIGSEVKIIAK